MGYCWVLGVLGGSVGVLQGTTRTCRVLQRNAGYCGVMQGSVGYCKVLRSTAGYTRGVLGGNYLGTVEYCKYWAELGEGTVLVVPRSTLKYPSVPRSTLQYPEVPCSTLQYPAVPLSTPQYPPWTSKYSPVLGVLGGTRSTGCTACYPPVPFSTL